MTGLRKVFQKFSELLTLCNLVATPMELGAKLSKLGGEDVNSNTY
jgi:hypothetical protein